MRGSKRRTAHDSNLPLPSQTFFFVVPKPAHAVPLGPPGFSVNTVLTVMVKRKLWMPNLGNMRQWNGYVCILCVYIYTYADRNGNKYADTLIHVYIYTMTVHHPMILKKKNILMAELLEHSFKKLRPFAVWFPMRPFAVWLPIQTNHHSRSPVT